MHALTNAQAALFAAVEASKNRSSTYSSPYEVKHNAEEYLRWLNDNSEE